MSPRVNIDDDLESTPEFRRLLPLVGGDSEKAMGKLVFFFRIAQKAFVSGKTLSLVELEQQDISEMVKSGWAVPINGGFEAKDSEKRFGWLTSKIAGGKKRHVAAKRDDATGRFLSSSAGLISDAGPAESSRAGLRTDIGPAPDQQKPAELANVPALSQQSPAGHHPPALAPSLTLKSKGDIYARARAAPVPETVPGTVNQDVGEEDFTSCETVWLESIQALGVERNYLDPQEDEEIRRLIARFGVEQTKKGLEGIRYEARNEHFDVRCFVDIKRAWKRMAAWCDLVDKPETRHQSAKVIDNVAAFIADREANNGPMGGNALIATRTTRTTA